MIKLFFQVVPIACLIGVLYAVFRYWHIQKQGLSVAWGTEIIRFLFVCYVTGLINLVLVPSNLWTAIWFYLIHGYSSGASIGPLLQGNFNFVPTIYRVMRGELILGSWVKTMLIGNFLMFIPMGLFLPFAWKRINGRTIVPVALAIPIIVELIQPIVGRSFDIDDILVNFVGIILGYLLAALLMVIRKKLGGRQ